MGERDQGNTKPASEGEHPVRAERDPPPLSFAGPSAGADASSILTELRRTLAALLVEPTHLESHLARMQSPPDQCRGLAANRLLEASTNGIGVLTADELRVVLEDFRALRTLQAAADKWFRAELASMTPEETRLFEARSERQRTGHLPR